MAFLSQYRTLRGSDCEDMGEVDYNFGRAFHQLGSCLPQVYYCINTDNADRSVLSCGTAL